MKKIFMFCALLFGLALVQAHEKTDICPDLPDIVLSADINADVVPAVNSVDVSVKSTAVDFKTSDYNSSAINSDPFEDLTAPDTRRQNKGIIYKKVDLQKLKYKKQKIPLNVYR